MLFASEKTPPPNKVALTSMTSNNSISVLSESDPDSDLSLVASSSQSKFYLNIKDAQNFIIFLTF